MKPRTDTTQFRADAHRSRVQMLVRSLSAARRAEIACRIRFYTMPFLRRADTPDLGDMLP